MEDNSKKGVLIGLIVLIVAIVGIVALTQSDPEPLQDVETTDKAEEQAGVVLEDGVYAVDAADSSVVWRASKRGGVGPHNGVVSVDSGSVTVADGALADGMVTIDMTTIEVIDDGSGNSELDEHLNSADFFETDVYPTATVEVVSVAANNLTANLTIRDITSEVTVPVTITTDGGVLTAMGEFEVDRETFRVATDSTLANIGLADTFTLEFNFVANLEA